NEILKGIKALADENRLKILKLLLTKNLCVRGLAHHLDISESGVSQQLKILRESELVRGEKEGYYVHYKVVPEKIVKIGEFIIEMTKSSKNDNSHSHKSTDYNCS
ncbi:MAG: helix-turn-helix transcriptional regulator, partial [Candidatus Cloacimonetes bacterium]|nr:helix-turn-helix transcriptional regulator [Candidatus Cloacimonadota bacterium]